MAFLCTESRIAEASLEDISSAGLLSLKKIDEMKIHIIFIISTHYKCEICDEERKTYGAAGVMEARYGAFDVLKILKKSHQKSKLRQGKKYKTKQKKMSKEIRGCFGFL